MKKVFFHPAAEEEMDVSADYYESKAKGLGIKFVDEIEKSLKQVSLSPNRWPIISGQTRRYLLRRFHYCLLYQIYGDDIYVLAVMHFHRKPDYWKKRNRQQWRK
ncbi:MAG: type II toxin-antitoxin system RelE/ParE family toxin [bacterium]